MRRRYGAYAVQRAGVAPNVERFEVDGADIEAKLDTQLSQVLSEVVVQLPRRLTRQPAPGATAHDGSWRLFVSRLYQTARSGIFDPGGRARAACSSRWTGKKTRRSGKLALRRSRTCRSLPSRRRVAGTCLHAFFETMDFRDAGDVMTQKLPGTAVCCHLRQIPPRHGFAPEPRNPVGRRRPRSCKASQQGVSEMRSPTSGDLTSRRARVRRAAAQRRRPRTKRTERICDPCVASGPPRGREWGAHRHRLTARNKRAGSSRASARVVCLMLAVLGALGIAAVRARLQRRSAGFRPRLTDRARHWAGSSSGPTSLMIASRRASEGGCSRVRDRLTGTGSGYQCPRRGKACGEAPVEGIADDPSRCSANAPISPRLAARRDTLGCCHMVGRPHRRRASRWRPLVPGHAGRPGGGRRAMAYVMHKRGDPEDPPSRRRFSRRLAAGRRHRSRIDRTSARGGAVVPRAPVSSPPAASWPSACRLTTRGAAAAGRPIEKRRRAATPRRRRHRPVMEVRG